MRVHPAHGTVTQLGSRVRMAMFLRSFAVQGSWNYRTLIGAGFAFALMPALRTLYADQPARLNEAIARHCRLFNSHPYLTPMALAAVAQLEAESEDPAVVERFKTAVRGSLGSLGDRLVWAAWRPACLLFSLALLFAGAAWWAGVAAFLLLYNAGHLLLRVWSYRLGLREGKSIGERLRHSPIERVQRAVTMGGAFLVGMIIPMAATGAHFWAPGLMVDGMFPAYLILAGTVGAILGARFGGRVRRPVILLLVAVALIGTVRGILQ
jgi:PTS system mannose-specific IID component